MVHDLETAELPIAGELLVAQVQSSVKIPLNEHVESALVGP